MNVWLSPFGTRPPEFSKVSANFFGVYDFGRGLVAPALVIARLTKCCKTFNIQQSLVPKVLSHHYTPAEKTQGQKCRRMYILLYPIAYAHKTFVTIKN
jgi:hypothetical protein